ncbi:Smr/MutS family protein [Thiothrix winogradskyi]|uniref:Smr/MutS family endonuclease n=1 Tax=Thiothrix winogradskyi TaxID=96472 RepID=A0ABY3T1U9_9GAMM|nr:Smr/MutS family protein [Thiothrix winogradskyi]UJS25786.1 Smr/MutS family endonuclease [Thiothrix winogradskyi]
MSTEEFSLFRESMHDVKPLRVKHHVVHHSVKPPAIPMKTLEDERQVLRDMLSDAYDPIEIQPGDMLSYYLPGLQNRIVRKLRSGHYRIASELDLHGLNARDAKQQLLKFLHDAHPGQGECVRIIHGKGNRSAYKGPVIKTKINNWLRQHERILAFHSARPVDGGTGAIYVLLRR